MAITYKRVGAVQPVGTITTASTLYLAASAASTSSVLSTVVICNTASTSATYRLGVSTTASFETTGYLVYGATVNANDSVFLTLGVSLDPTNRYLLASTSASTVVLSAFGVENS